ncbi:RsmB/NOP family class I SAM-dependent RNA methyltransferase [Basilea psittacipulmonis]|uniref:rRNA methyltransferase n=1 Tax=Basilea psittacipulmonis DSM 24701 TaxID=1072685 RepID=A0A077DEA1_9BURK|nr:RsmB/NOP family class I SAM-dependent RNA methyltransferase [Basilea psittacipulmonis]AIL32496.1 rRNA methyltransferase [Basilea psittacipulmonis DSM 24701]
MSKPHKHPVKKRQNNQATHRRDISKNKVVGRIEQIESVLKEILNWEHPADVILSQWFRKHKQLGARDRHEVAEAVFDVLRHLKQYRQYAESGFGSHTRRLAILGLYAVIGESIFSQLQEEEKDWLKRLALIDPESLSPDVRFSMPTWLIEKLTHLPDANNLFLALNEKAPLDLRVNIFKANREDILEKVKAYEPQAQATPYSPWGIRLWNKPALSRWPMFEAGEIEVQDEGSQILGMLLAPKRGEMVVDYCAGAGGKTLLLGALMRSTGRLYAFDVSESRLSKAKPRLARSGLSNVTTVVLHKEKDERVKRLAGKADRVLVDAPCTGMGTLRRNPDLKWRQTPEDLKQLVELQSKILDQACTLLKPGGRLVYSTCSLLPQENELQIQSFLNRHPEFELKAVNDLWDERCTGLVMQDAYLKLRPDYHQTDGFFAAVLEKRK